MKKIYVIITFLILATTLVFPQSISITSPTSNSDWEKGEAFPITWTKSGAQDSNVKIRLFNQAGVKVLDIDNNTPNDGHFLWTVPASIAIGKYAIRVKTLDNNVSKDSPLFDIVDPASSAPPATLTVTNPTSPTYSWKHAVANSIIWQKTGVLQTDLRIDLLNASGSQTITNLFLNVSKTSNSKNWIPPISIPDGPYRIRVSTMDGQVSGNSNQFQVDKNPSIAYPVNYHGSITGLATPSRNIRRGGNVFTPGTKPMFIVIKFNNVNYSENMLTPMATNSQPIQIKLSAVCSASPILYRVVINLANPTQPGRELHFIKDTGWQANGNFTIYIPSNDLNPIMEGGGIPTYFDGQVLIYAKAGNPEKSTSKTCNVRFSN